MAPVPLSPLQISRRSRLPYHEVQRLIATLTQEDVHPGLPLSPGIAAATEPLIRKRQAGIPLQYLEGHIDFGPVHLATDKRALIPRPETEQLWELATETVRTSPPEVIVDIGTGSGALALALSHSFPDARVVATDISAGALELAHHNLLANRWARDRISLQEGDLFEALSLSLRGKVNLLVSNPPYVAEGEWPHLPAEVRAEPYQALVAGPRGTEVLERLAAEVRSWLSPAGLVIAEMGETQGETVKSAFRAGGMDVRIHCDLADRPRFVVGRLPAR